MDAPDPPDAKTRGDDDSACPDNSFSLFQTRVFFENKREIVMDA
jgi:hypothetical protein